MQHINLFFPQVEFHGRNGLSRSLKARFAETHFLYTFMALALTSGFIAGMNVFMPLVTGHFKTVLNFSSLFQVLFFAGTSYLAWVLKKTSDLRIHLHGERIIFEEEGKPGVGFAFSDIHALRIHHKKGVYGIYLILKSGEMHHFPIHLERLDYILDTLHFHRSDLTHSPEFMQFRKRALAMDHVLAHNQSYLSRAHIKAVSFYLLYPLYILHSLKRVHADPQQVRRDMEYEKRMETLCHKVNIGLGLVMLAVIVLWKYHL